MNHLNGNKNTKHRLLGIVTDIETRLVNIKRDFFEIGKLLSEAKKILPHGTFQSWIKERFGKELPYSTAALYMKIYETFKDCPKGVQYIPITLLMKMTQDAFPEEIFKIITENLTSDKLDAESITEAYSLFKAKKIDLSEFENIAKKQIDLALNMEWGHTQRRINNEFKETINFGFSGLIGAIKKIRNKTLKMSFLVYPDFKESILNEIDLTISQLKEFKEKINYEEGFFKSSEDIITGKRQLVPKEELKIYNN